MVRISSNPENITVGQAERAIAYAWKCFDSYENYASDLRDKKGTELYRKYQKARGIAEGLNEYAPWLFPTGLP